MFECDIDGIKVLFPYEPYQLQIEYMKKVIQCLRKGVNGMLESPTGTGKTLSLLCSSLAWLESCKAQHQLSVINGSNSTKSATLSNLRSALGGLTGLWDPVTSLRLPRIIYSSRTHSQLSQAIQELKRSNYKYVKSVVLGSRDQLCLHPEVMRAADHSTKVYLCRAKLSSKACPFFLNYEEKMASQDDYQNAAVLDIEDLVSLGKRHTVCPYFSSRAIKSKVDIIFTPYNYIIDPKSRRAHGIELDGNVLIIDEAHNIEGACEESMSFQLRSLDLALCINEVSQAMEKLKKFEQSSEFSDSSGGPEFTIADLSVLKVMFSELEEVLDLASAELTGKGTAKPGDYMIEVLEKIELTPRKKELVVDMLDKIILYMTQSEGGSMLGSKGAGLQKFSDLLHILFSKTSSANIGSSEYNYKSEFTNKYQVFLQQDDTPAKKQNSINNWVVSKDGTGKKQKWKLDCWCFSPGIGMQDIACRGVHSIILTSGTLSPLGPMISELGVPFPVTLESPHIIKDNQVYVAVVTVGPDGTALNSSFQNRSNNKYVSSLGRSICNFCRIVPNGFLVFFPSYAVMRQNITFWEENGIWQSLSSAKQVFTEPQGRDAFQESIEKYYETINEENSKGATFLGVCRGKVSEGLDFADHNARAVVITGLPFPPFLDPRVKMKMDYLNAVARLKRGQGDTKVLLGQEWYTLQASRAVNQAIGRVIRHKDDYGAILLCDNRFKDRRIQDHLSKWIHGRIKVFDSFGPALKQLSTFYKSLDQNPLRLQPNATHQNAFYSNSVRSYKLNSSQQNPQQDERKPADNSLFDGYKSQSSTASASGAPNSKSIFDAIETEAPSSGQPNDSNSAHYDHSETTISSKILPNFRPKDSKRRRINIELRQAHPLEEDKHSPEMWKKYLAEVKLLFGVTEQYATFCASIKNFKLSKNVEAFAHSLKSVFSTTENKLPYLQTAALLVGQKDREKFLSIAS